MTQTRMTQTENDQDDAVGICGDQRSALHALCVVCGRTMPVTKVGVVRVHGPLVNRCTGSGMPPSLSASINTSPPPALPSSAAGRMSPVPRTSSPSSLSELLLPLFRASSSARVLKRIPRASRHLAATNLAAILDVVVEKNDATSWNRLLRFSSRCLTLPKRGGRRRNLAAAVNQQLRDEVDLAPQALRRDLRSRFTRDPLSHLAERVSAKLEEGDYTGAVRIACSEDSIAFINQETLSELKAKHPPAHPDSNFPPAPESPALLAEITEREVARAIKSFPCGSAGGPDGLRPQHLKDLTSESAERGGKELLRALSSFILLVLEGNTPLSIQPIFFGANLIALRKKGGGIRPIAVGQTLRRLVAKCGGFRVVESIGASLAPLQLGYGVPSGCEAAAHAARQYLGLMSSGQVMVKLDFKNAFNCLRRDKILQAVRSTCPELFHFVYSAYSTPSSLFCGEYIIQSEEGVQQGDPLGPLLFCLTIHPIISRLQSEFKVFYLDDGTLGGPVEAILQDLQQLELEAAELGLQLNHGKSELICDEGSTRETVLQKVPGLRQVGCSQATLLGSPIGSEEAINDAIRVKTGMLEVMGNRLNLLPSHDALLLLRSSFAIPKVLYLLRTAPCFYLLSWGDLMICFAVF